MKEYVVNISNVNEVNKTDIAKFALSLCYMIPLRILAILAGFFIVPVALLFRTKGKEFSIGVKGQRVTKQEIHLPKWAWLWDNDEEGMSSRFQPWWNEHDGNAESFWAMFKWACIRNPANNMRGTKMFQCDMTRCKHIVFNTSTWHFVKSTNIDNSKVYYTYRYRRPNELFGYKGDLIVHLGFKCFPYTLNQYAINPAMADQWHHRYRGFALQIIPLKGKTKIK